MRLGRVSHEQNGKEKQKGKEKEDRIRHGDVPEVPPSLSSPPPSSAPTLRRMQTSARRLRCLVFCLVECRSYSHTPGTQQRQNGRQQLQKERRREQGQIGAWV